MFGRAVFLFSVLLTLLHAGADDNATIKNSETAALLAGYDPTVIRGDRPLKSDTNVDSNDTDRISPKTKLDDVSNLDIAKEQRKQRQSRRDEGADDKEARLVDTVVVKGSVLQGQITELTSESIEFRLIYGSGRIRIAYEDIEAIESEHEYHIFFDGKETEGIVVGIKDHAFLQVKHGEIMELVTISKIDRIVISTKEDNSIENIMRNTFPYWSGNIDIGVELESGSNLKKKLKIAGHVERNKGANRSYFDLLYDYELTETPETNTTVLNKDEEYFFGENDYTFYAQNFFFVQAGYDYDIPRLVDGRFYPALGYGYRLGDKKEAWIQFKIGGGYVYEEFIGYGSDQYGAAFVGIDARYRISGLSFLDGVLLEENLFYMPGIADPHEQWLFRNTTAVSFPIGKSLAFKMVMRNVNDDNPSPDVGNNKTTFDLYLSLQF